MFALAVHDPAALQQLLVSCAILNFPIWKAVRGSQAAALLKINRRPREQRDAALEVRHSGCGYGSARYGRGVVVKSIPQV